MAKIKRIEFKDLLLFNQDKIFNFENNFIVANVTKQDMYLTKIFPIRTSFYMFVLIEAGFMTIELNYSTHLLKKQDLLFILPDHIFLRIDGSSDVAYKLIFIDQEHFNSINLGKIDFFVSRFPSLRRTPVINLSKIEYALLSSIHNKFIKIISKPHHFKGDLINVLILQFVVESSNIIIVHNENNLQPLILSRQEELVENFIQLLNTNLRSEHQVKFYADKLNITTQYLSAVLQKITGTGTKEWIARFVLTEAKIMLRKHHQTVKQIADDLLFHDQSAFGKFFKFHTGQTPKEYQNNIK